MFFCLRAGWIACTLELKTPRCSRRAACMRGEVKYPLLPCKKVLWGCWLLLSHWWKSALPLCVCYFACPALTELCPSVLSNKVVESCCLAKTGKWKMAIHIVFRTTWLTRRLKREGWGANSTNWFGSWKGRRANTSSPNPTTCCLREVAMLSTARVGPGTWKTMNSSPLVFFIWGGEEKSERRVTLGCLWKSQAKKS